MVSSAHRESWQSRLGFIFAAVGSAVGLANIWKFPYTVGKSGGAAFILLYLASLMLIGFPVFISEILIGRATQTSPKGAMKALGKSPGWERVGAMMVLTGFIVSAFYSAVAGWVLGYFIEALRGSLSSMESPQEAIQHYDQLMSSPLWGVGFHGLFLAICSGIVLLGVQKGIERASKIMMPLLLTVLAVLVFKGLALPGAGEGLKFLLEPDWSVVTPSVALAALGQSFFTLSVGQGTMITYGSYLDEKANIPASCVPIALIDTLISILSAVAIFTVVFSVGMEPTAGPGLLFHTLPVVFSQLPGGYLMAVLFFSLVSLAAISSEISAMEPLIAYLMDEWKWTRKQGTALCASAAFIVGVPCALSANLLSGHTLWGMTFLDLIAFVATDLLVPLGGLAAVILVGWRWGMGVALAHLQKGAEKCFDRAPWLKGYFYWGIRYVAPLLMVLVFAHEMGWF